MRLNFIKNERTGAADNLHFHTNGALAQTFNVDILNQLSTVTRTGPFTETGATPAPATNITVNGGAAQTYADFTFARTNLSLVNGTNIFTNIAQNVYGVTVTNSITVNLPATNSYLSDANGNLTNDGLRNFVYNAENELTNINITGQWKIEFVYDGLWRKRIERDYAWQSSNWVKTNEIRFIYDGLLPIQERDGNNVVQVTYTRGVDLSGSGQGGGGIGGLLARTDGNGSAFYHSDGAGNITALIDGNQNIIGRYEYDAFGRMLGMWGIMAPANRVRFSSMFTDQSGLDHFAFRDYDPIVPRFLERDPIGERGGINLYRFVGNNPINFVDPYGLSIGNYFGFTSAPSEANQAMQSLVQAHGYANMDDYAMQNPSYNGWNPTDAVAPAANTAAAATDLYMNGMQAIVPAGIAAKGTEAAAQGIADAAEEGWLSKLLKKCKSLGKKPPKTPPPTRYYISDGVRRALAARESGNPAIDARLVTPGQPDQFIQVPLDQLDSPKPYIDASDPRFSPQLRPNYPPIEVQPSGLPGQVQTTPVPNVQIR